jgi:hypothetical protein
MKAIKGLVIFMSILLVAGLILLGYGLFNQASKIGGKNGAAAPARTASGDGFGRVEVPLPAGARIDDVIEANGKIVLRLVGGGGDRFLVLDPDSGDVAGAFVMIPEAPAR